MRKLTKGDIENIIGRNIEEFRIEAAQIKNGPYTDGHYVTWQFHLLDDESISAYWGHYFGNNRDAAVQDFNTRRE